MKIAAYEVRPDEKPVIERLCKQYDIELVSTPANLDKTTASMAAGCDGVTTLGQSDYCNEVLDELKGYGVEVLASRCVGYNHMNCDYARSLGFRLCNGAYAPNGAKRTMVRPPVIFEETELPPYNRGPYLGEQTEIILKKLGYTDEQVAAMIAAGEAQPMDPALKD